MKLYLHLALACTLIVVFFSHEVLAAQHIAPKAKVIYAQKHDTSSVPVREIKKPRILKPKQLREIPLHTLPPETGSPKTTQDLYPGQGPESVQMLGPVVSQLITNPPMLLPSAAVDFEGINNIAGVAPPDTCGDVGPDHYVQAVNLHFQVFDKAGATLLGPLPLNAIWSGFGGVCETLNNGDPIVLYDQWADRWLISQFALDYGGEGFHQCLAVSTTGDPTGTWSRYDYFMSGTIMNDYPKFGVWPDGYYMSINQFDAANGYFYAGQGVAVFERDKMLEGQAAQMQYLDLLGSGLFGMLPSDGDGIQQPPAGEANHFVRFDRQVDQLVMYDFHVDWTNPGNTTFTQALGSPVAVDPFVWFADDVPQPDTTQLLDVIGDRLMYRLQYRNFGSHTAMVVNHTVNVGGVASIRWYELRNTGGAGWVINQQGTYAGDAPDGNHRWMGSIAMDSQQNIALGYSVTGSGLYPSIRYTGRLPGDLLGTLPQGETELVAGGGSQTGTNRWGDYSMMSVDPVNECTFWYTQEYYPVTTGWDWHTRIGSFTFPGCAPGLKGELNGIVHDTAGGPVAEAVIKVDDGAGIVVSTTSAPDGTYKFAVLPPGTYTVTASKYNYLDVNVAGVAITDGGVTTLDFDLILAPIHTLDGYVTDATTGIPLYAQVNYGYGTVWTDPLTGFYSIDLPQDNYTVDATSFVAGYDPVIRSFLLDTNRTEDFPLPFSGSCDAPGYSLAAPLAERFTPCVLPSGWNVVNNGGNCEWRFDDPGGTTNLTGGSGCFGVADSDTCGDGTMMDTELISPSVDCSGMQTVTLEFKYDVNDFGSRDTFEVDISIDGGINWNTVWNRNNIDDRGPLTAVVDISLEAAGQPDVLVRFHYIAPGWDWWWQVDDVFIFEDPAEKTICNAPADGGYVYGHVYDGNTDAALNNALVEDGSGNRVFSVATPEDSLRPDGFYALYVSGSGTADLTASLAAPSGYGPDLQTVQIPVLTGTVQDFFLPAGALGAIPASIRVSVPPDGVEQVDFLLQNAGGLAASFNIAEREGILPLSPEGPFAEKTRHMSPKHLDDLDASGARFSYPDPGVPPLATAGIVLQSWASGLPSPWGTAFDKGTSRIWLGNIAALAGDDRNYEFETKGLPTGRVLDVSKPLQTYMADFAYDAVNKTLWQVNVGGDNCIYELDTATLTFTGNTICPAFGTSQRGLAYNLKTDTFYAGSWNDSTIYEFDRSGTILRSVNVGQPISGLAFNPVTDHLFVMNSIKSIFPVTVLDVQDNFSARYGIAIQGFSDYGGAGLAMDCEGDLWATDQVTGITYEVGSGEIGDCSTYEIPWLTATPAAGSTGEGSSSVIALGFDATGLVAGETREGYLIVESDTPYTSTFVPVTMNVVNLPVVGAITKQTAEVSLVVNPNCLKTEYYFEYGTTEGIYDWRTASIFRSSCSPITIEAVLEGLLKDTTYFVRLVTINTAGTVYSGFVSFTTDKFPWLLIMPLINAQSPFLPQAMFPTE